jgi:hypothetical protein
MAAAQAGMINLINAGATSFNKHIQYQHNAAIVFGCDYGKGQDVSASGLNYDLGCVNAQCGTTQSGWNSHHSWKSTFGRAQGSFSC